MRWGVIQLKTSADGVESLEYTKRQTKTRSSVEPNDIRAVKPKMFSVPASGLLAIQETEEVSLSMGNQQSPQQALSLFQGANIQGGTFNISINSVFQQSPNLPLHRAKRRHYMIQSDSD